MQLDKEKRKFTVLDEEKRKFVIQARIAEIDRETPQSEYHEFTRFMEENYPTTSHYFRYCKTFSLMLKYGFDVDGKVLFETGSPCPITHFVQSRAARSEATKGDLRYAIDSEDEVADIVLSFEVMEHIKDQTEKKFDDVVLFNESGVQRFASEIVRILKPGGVFFLTTPNATSLFAIQQGLKGRPPVLFRPHVREYVREEIQDMFSSLVVEAYETPYSIYYFSEKSREPLIKKIFSDQGFPAENRGDSHFFKFRKPVKPA